MQISIKTLTGKMIDHRQVLSLNVKANIQARDENTPLAQHLNFRPIFSSLIMFAYRLPQCHVCFISTFKSPCLIMPYYLVMRVVHPSGSLTNPCLLGFTLQLQTDTSEQINW